MERLRFSWRYKKAQTNLKKHGVDFHEASTVFSDEFAAEFFDPDHSETEERYLLVGISALLRILVISFCYRQNEEVIHIISARKATQKEQTYYRGRRK